MVNTGSLAAVPDVVPEEQPAEAVAPAPARSAAQPRQAMLFQDRSQSKVIPFDGVYETAVPPKPKASTRATGRVHARRPGAPNDAQPSFGFLQPAPQAPRKLGTKVEAVIDCDAPVASPMHRACAAAIDASMILIGCGVFFTTFYLLGGSLGGGKPALVVVSASVLLIAMFYGFVWACAGARTPGMRALSLTLINFDGYPPDALSRWLRFAGACLGYCAGGLGLLWALLDEESLSWHDHISKTFPTFQGPETSFVRRR